VSLVETQRRIWRLVTAPSGVAQALRDEGDAPSEAKPSLLASLIRGEGAADATTRLDVYANAYFYRIHGVLEKDYPALAKALGDDAFNDVVTSYLLVHPSTHPSLRYAGAELGAFLADHAAAKGVRQRAPWASDLARLEWAMVDAFDAADAAPLARDAVAALAPERFASLTLELRPGTSLLVQNWPVHSLRAACDAGEAVEAPANPAPESVVVWRPSETVRYRTADAVEATALSLLRNGTTFGELCDHLARSGDEDSTPAVAAALLERWLADGLLANAQPPV
jgi:hypothetical protein